MLLFVAVMIFGAVFFGTLAVYGPAFERQKTMQERIQRVLIGLAEEKPQNSEHEIRADEAKPSLQRMRQRLRKVGLYRHSDLEEAMRFRRICYLVPISLTAVLYFMGFPTDQTVICGGLFALIFYLIPRARWVRLALRRRKEIQRCLPDTLDLFTLCLEAGLSFDAAMVRVANEQERVSTQISRELKMTQQEIQAGVPRAEALTNLGERTDVEDVKTLTGAIVQSIKLGTSLVKTLRVQAEVIRQTRRERVKAEILKTPVKLLFPLLFFIFPTLLNVILGPTLITIFRQLSRPEVQF